MPTRDMTIFSAEIVDFAAVTAWMSKDKVMNLLEIFERLCHPVFINFNGRVVGRTKETYLVAFDSPADAVMAGIRLQAFLREFNLGRRLPMRLRIGIGAGEVSLENNVASGAAVDAALRIRALTPADCVYFSQAVYDAVGKEVKSEPVPGSFAESMYCPEGSAPAPESQAAGEAAPPSDAPANPADAPSAVDKLKDLVKRFAGKLAGKKD